MATVGVVIEGSGVTSTKSPLHVSPHVSSEEEELKTMQSTIPQTVTPSNPPRRMASTSTELLRAQLDWFRALAAQGTASEAVTTMQEQIEAELAHRSQQMIEALGSIVQRPQGYVAVHEWKP